MAKQNGGNGGFDPSEFGGEELSSVEFWKPTRGSEGETIVGTITEFGTGKVGADTTRYLKLSPALVVKAGRGEAYDALKVGVNSVLGSKLDDRKHVGRHVSITFEGYERTQSGEMRLYRVREYPADAMRRIWQKFAPSRGGDGTDDLPF